MKILLGFSIFLMVIGFSACAPDSNIPPDGVDPIDKFLGTWNVSDNATKINYEVTIERSTSNTTLVILSNFAGSGDVAVGLVAGNSIVLNYQQIGQNWFVIGNGTFINANRLDFRYTLEIGGNQEDRIAIFVN